MSVTLTNEEAQQVCVTEETLPATRDKNGHLVKYPGRIVYVHDNWRLVYLGTVDGKHKFFAEEVTRINLGGLSFKDAKAAMVDLINYNKQHQL